MQYHPTPAARAERVSRDQRGHESLRLSAAPPRPLRSRRARRPGGRVALEGFGPAASATSSTPFGAATQAAAAPLPGRRPAGRPDLASKKLRSAPRRASSCNRTELCGTCNGLRAEPGTEPSAASPAKALASDVSSAGWPVHQRRRLRPLSQQGLSSKRLVPPRHRPGTRHAPIEVGSGRRR